MMKMEMGLGLGFRHLESASPSHLKGAILLAKRCKMDKRFLGEGPTSRRGKVSCLLHGISLEGNTRHLNQEMQF
jgi:hypothetical protein